MTSVTQTTPRELAIDTDDAGTVVWQTNEDLLVALNSAQERNEGIVGGLTHAERVVVVGLEIDRDPELTEVHTSGGIVPSLEVVEAAIVALQVVRDALKR